MTEDTRTKSIDLDEMAGKFEQSCKEAISRLSDEKERLETELRKEYRNARKFVRTNPEEGVAYAFLGGIVLGVMLTRIFSR